MGTYAKNTDVTSDKSRAEIEHILDRYGADEFAYMSKRGLAAIAFTTHDRQVRFVLPLPDRDDDDFRLTPTGKLASDTAAAAKYEQAVRQRWRALALVIKAKLEAIESNIATFEQEFGMNIVLPDGRTVYEHTKGWIDDAYNVGTVPPLVAIEPA